MYPVKAYSWTVCSENVFYKKIDKSVMLNRGSGIPMEIKRFWDVEDLDYGDEKALIMAYDDQTFKMKITIDKLSRARLFWNSDFAQLLSLKYSELKLKYMHSEEIDFFPEIRFDKISSKKYVIDFVDEFDDSMMYNDYLDLGGKVEGKKVVYYSETYERSKANREVAIQLHGLKCKACGFKFEDTYGRRGKGFIEIHHKNPLYINETEVRVNPRTDLVPVCSNCHRMIHRKRNEVLCIEQLIKIIETNKMNNI